MSKCGVKVKFRSHRCFCNLPIEINAFGDVFKKEKLGGDCPDDPGLPLEVVGVQSLLGKRRSRVLHGVAKDENLIIK